MNDTKSAKKLLIIGASILQLPAIKLAKELGYYVGVIDYNPNAIGVPYADEFFNVSTIDIDGVVKTAEAFAPDGIMTLATDMPMRSIAAACEKLGLRGISFDTAIKSTDKGEMIRAFEANGVEHPWYYILSNPDDLEDVIAKITFPCISKPTDNSGSRGVMLIHNQDELRDAISYSSKNGRSGGVIVEEYMVGPEVSVEIMAVDGQPYVLQVTDKLTTGAPHFVETGHKQPANLSSEMYKKVEDTLYKAFAAMDIQYGAIHPEFRITKEGRICFMEIGARMGGDCIGSDLVPISSGYDYMGMVIACGCGKEPSFEKINEPKEASIKYIITKEDLAEFERIKKEEPDVITRHSEIKALSDNPILKSADRTAYYIMAK